MTGNFGQSHDQNNKMKRGEYEETRLGILYVVDAKKTER